MNKALTLLIVLLASNNQATIKANSGIYQDDVPAIIALSATAGFISALIFSNNDSAGSKIVTPQKGSRLRTSLYRWCKAEGRPTRIRAVNKFVDGLKLSIGTGGIGGLLAESFLSHHPYKRFKRVATPALALCLLTKGVPHNNSDLMKLFGKSVDDNPLIITKSHLQSQYTRLLDEKESIEKINTQIFTTKQLQEHASIVETLNREITNIEIAIDQLRGDPDYREQENRYHAQVRAQREEDLQREKINAEKRKIDAQREKNRLKLRLLWSIYEREKNRPPLHVTVLNPKNDS